MKNLTFIDRLIRLFLAVISTAAVVWFVHHPAARILFGAFGILALVELFFGRCWALRRLGQETASNRLHREIQFLLGLVLIQFVLAYEWWSAGWEKISGSAFVDGIGKTLGFFASQNPFPWYKNFLLGFAAQHAAQFAYAVEWSQVAFAVVLLGTGISILYVRNTAVRRAAFVLAICALVGGMFMNANFYLASGWTGPGTKGINVVMFWAQAMLVYTWIFVW